MLSEELRIMDASGSIAHLRIIVADEVLNYLRDHPGSEYTGSNAMWHTISCGLLGAELGELYFIPGGSDTNDLNIYHLEFQTRLPNNRRSLMILKRWRTSRGNYRLGTGTLYNGVNLVLRPGALDWSRIA